MPVVTFPDGTQKQFERPVSIGEIAQSLGPGLAKAALAAKVGQRLVDTTYTLSEDTALRILTERDPEGVDILRHSCAHLLAHAVKTLYPEVQVTIGPVIEDGFYYDFASPHPFSETDLASIEEKMRELAKANFPVRQYVLSREEAVQLFEGKGEHYKVDIIRSIPLEEPVTLYQQGDFVDLCRGPHVPSTGKIKAFKLLKVAGAYWRGDAKNPMLQRIYGTAWPDTASLEKYLRRLEEAEKRDHRKLAKQLDLLHFQEEAPGMVFWHPKGWLVYQQVVQYMRELWRTHGYQEVNTPALVERTLWERSGHWDMFHQHMYTVSAEEKVFAIKPMNCPCHVQIFNQGVKSYRDLPLRLAEFGSCYRYEPSGALHGLMRVRQFVQDDAHIFCTESQIQSEVSAFIALLFQVYRDFGFQDIIIKLATRPTLRVGEEALWDKAEAALIAALAHQGLSFEHNPGEGAFYGPKIEFVLRDCLGRMWQCGTVQVDFSMPLRLQASYVAEEGTRQTPVMIHRAILGSLERFIGILMEEQAGYFPFWLAPVQAVVMTITDKHASYAEEVAAFLQAKGMRIVTDLRNEKIGFKIREHTLQRVPYLLVVGDKEVAGRMLSVRTRKGDDQGVMTLEAFAQKAMYLQKEKKFDE